MEKVTRRIFLVFASFLLVLLAPAQSQPLSSFNCLSPASSLQAGSAAELTDQVRWANQEALEAIRESTLKRTPISKRLLYFPDGIVIQLRSWDGRLNIWNGDLISLGSTDKRWPSERRRDIVLQSSQAPSSSHSHFFPGWGRMTYQLLVYDPEQQLAVYYNWHFDDELIFVEWEENGKPPLIRNLGYHGMGQLFSNRAGNTLNSPPDTFPVTSLTLNYDWAESAYFPNAVRKGPYGHYVFVVFPQEKIRVKATLREDPYVGPYLAQEFNTEDPIAYQDSLLVLGKKEYETILASRAKTRKAALRALNRTEEEQFIIENSVFEESQIMMGEEPHAENLNGVKFYPLYEKLLQFRAQSPIKDGMLFWVRAPSGAREVLLTGFFAGWKTSVGEGAIKMEPLGCGYWAAVVPRNRLDFGVEHELKFSAKKLDGQMEWFTGPYLVNQTAVYFSARLYKNFIFKIHGKEIFASKNKSARRLEAVQRMRVMEVSLFEEAV